MADAAGALPRAGIAAAAWGWPVLEERAEEAGVTGRPGEMLLHVTAEENPDPRPRCGAWLCAAATTGMAKGLHCARRLAGRAWGEGDLCAEGDSERREGDDVGCNAVDKHCNEPEGERMAGGGVESEGEEGQRCRLCDDERGERQATPSETRRVTAGEGAGGTVSEPPDGEAIGRTEAEPLREGFCERDATECDPLRCTPLGDDVVVIVRAEEAERSEAALAHVEGVDGEGESERDG